MAEFWDIISRKDFVLGKTVRKFEKDIAGYLKVKRVLAVASGSDALVITLKALGIGPGDEVIVTALGAFPTVSAVAWVNAIPVFVDADPNTLGMNTGGVEKKISKKTKAIIVAHLTGRLADIEGISNIAKRKSIALIEDSARAMGAKFKGNYTGFYSNAACLSFNPMKIMGGYGDGGAIATNDERIAETASVMRTYGAASIRDFNENHKTAGIASRLGPYQASVLALKFKDIDKIISRWRRNYLIYLDTLKGVGDLVLPRITDDDFVNGYEFHLFSKSRDELRGYLRKNGVNAKVQYYKPLPYLDVFKALAYKAGDFPYAENITREILTLPTHGLLTEGYIYRTVSLIRTFFQGGAL